MAVKTSTFGAVTLSNEEAEKFINQIKYGRPKKSALKLLEEGRRLMKQFDEQGKVVIPAKIKES